MSRNITGISRSRPTAARCSSILPSKLPAVRRIIAVGDIHGDWRAYRSVLKTAGLVNRHMNWTGADTHLVFLGDILDRLSRSYHRSDEMSESKILEHLLLLRGQARLVGGEVHLILGNHEIMNADGDFRYVSPMGTRDFMGDRSAFFATNQYGDIGRGRHLLACDFNTVIQIGSWIFSHAGVTHQVSSRHTIEEVNSIVRDYLLDHQRDLPEHISDMLWHRSYGDKSSCKAVQSSLRNWRARQMAVGHTVYDKIHNMCNGAIWKLDTGMSDAFGKRSEVSLIEILDDTEITVYKGRKE